jgi:hypothetical protein
MAEDWSLMGISVVCVCTLLPVTSLFVALETNKYDLLILLRIGWSWWYQRIWKNGIAGGIQLCFSGLFLPSFQSFACGSKLLQRREI